MIKLRNWAESKNCKPLLLRGARQVGKTFSVNKLGNEHFENICTIDFEQEPELRAAFALNLVPQRILKDLSSRKKTTITPGKTLLFFDEIQACPKAIMALRYLDARLLRTAIDLLNRSGLIHRISCCAASGIPLGAQCNEKKFKLLFLDIGLLNAKLNIPLDFLSQEDLLLVHAGALAEQFVGQELIAYSPPHQSAELFYWERTKKGSDAEVDYVIEIKGNIIPIEVKSGKSGKMRSLLQFMAEKNRTLGVRLSQAPLQYERGILSIPLYMTSELTRLTSSFL